MSKRPKSHHKKSMKFHAMALGIICVVVVILYWLIGPSDEVVNPADPDKGQGDRYVHVVDATWGQNCNTEINRLHSIGQTTIGEGAAQRPLETVKFNNAMYAVTQMCDDRIKCNILASSDTLESEPLPACYKELVVGYRCFSVDRKWTRKVEQGAVLTIDCNADIDQSKAGQDS